MKMTCSLGEYSYLLFLLFLSVLFRGVGREWLSFNTQLLAGTQVGTLRSHT